MTMDIGISLSSTSTLPPHAAARHLSRCGQAAREAGLASLSLGDSHARAGVGYLQNTPALGRLLADWTGRPAGCLFLLPLWPPVLVAEHVGTLAAFHDGPFIVQTGLGGSPAMFAALGASPERRVTVLEESMRVIQTLLSGAPASSDLFGFADVSIGLVPEQPVDWWMGTMSPAGVERAARFGAAWYASPGARLDELAALDHVYRATCETAGVRPRVMLRRDVIVSGDGEQARRLAADAVAHGYRGIDLAQLVVGSPADAADQLRPFQEHGIDQIVVRTMGLSAETDLESIEHLAEVRQLLAD